MSKYPRTPHFSWSEGATSDDRILSDNSNFIDHYIVITEKMDGSNTGFVKDGVYGRSHADFSNNPWDREMWNIYYRIKNDLYEGLYIFGENMYAIHSIEYQKLDSFFYIFGIRDNNVWISWDQLEEWSFLLDIPTVPVLFKGVIGSEKELKEITTELCSKKSIFGNTREGIVVRTFGNFHNDDFGNNVAKMVRKNHVTTDKHWTRNWKPARIF